MSDKYTVDDKGNEAIFYKKDESGEWEKIAVLDREAGDNANELAWHNWYNDALVESWAKENGYYEDLKEARYEQ